MKRAMLIVGAVALCVAGSAVAQDRGGLIGSGTRTDDSGQVIGSGNAAGQTMGSGGFTASTQDSGQFFGSGGRSAAGGQFLGSGGGFTASALDQIMGSGGRSDDSGQAVGSGTRTADAGGLIGSGTRQDSGGYFGSGLAVRALRLFDGVIDLLVVSSDDGTFVLTFEE